MHHGLLTGALALACSLAPVTGAHAQGRDSSARDTLPTGARDAPVPAALARQAVALFNAPTTLRATGSLAVDSSRQVGGDVAVHGGSLVVAGHVTGRVVVLNGDLVLRPGARIDGDVLVTGGRVEGAAGATLGGVLTAYRRPIDVRLENDVLVLREPPAEGDWWWDRWRTRQARDRSGIRLSMASTYNRVEGLPIHFGPVLRRRLPWGRLTAEAFGIYRTAAKLRWDAANIGHAARAEVEAGPERRYAAGGRLFDVVTPVEEWHITDAENGLATVFLHRDYQDHFGRQGATGYVRAAANPRAHITLALSDQRWSARAVRDPFTLFRGSEGWRPNPRLDEGRFRIASAALYVDTRNDVTHPWAGMFLKADYEYGRGGRTSAGARTDTAGASRGNIAWHRAFVDVRKYSRLAPNAQLNLRLVVGGSVGGDALPLNRRLSLGGPGTLPGYDFRRDAQDRLQCTRGSVGAAPGRPAECERVALAQAEYRSDVGFEVGGPDWARFQMRHRGEWVVFANSGRGWLVGEREGELQYRSGQLPTLRTFRTDVGTGIDFGGLGFYVAKSVTDADEPANFFVRARRRL